MPETRAESRRCVRNPLRDIRISIMSSAFDLVESWPRPGHPERYKTQLQDWVEAVSRLEDAEEREFARSLPNEPPGKAMFECIFGASPFLSNCMIAEPGFVRKLWTQGPDQCIGEVFEELGSMPPDYDERTAGNMLRIARRRTALLVALADIAGIWPLETVTQTLSAFAEVAISTALRVQVVRLENRGVLEPSNSPAPEAESGLFALGLGKLGGRELNYSSDIDLILLYDPDKMPAKNPPDIQRHLVRLARSLVSLLTERTMNGYVFRVDLRLRPDPGATPLVISTEAAEHYYEARGQTWERAALIKARPVGGDGKAAAAFLRRISPFVWRRHLDFATVQELHDMKRRIDAHRGGGGIRAQGHDVKLGRGGIREIEFFAQSHQLIWGGKDPRLRIIPTCETLTILANSGRIPNRVAKEFIESYNFLRRVEHRVQMVDDEQTHSLPEDAESLETMARFLGYEDTGAFSVDLIGHLKQVEGHYAEFFELPLEMAGERTPSLLSTAQSPEAIAGFETLGFKNPEAVSGILSKWRSGRYQVAQGSRSRELLDALTPSLLTAMIGTADPDLAIVRFDRFLARLPTGLQVFALFQANLHVMETVAEIMVSAPAIAEQLTVRPGLFEALLESDTESVAPTRSSLEKDLAVFLGSAPDYADMLDRLSRWADAARFRVGIHMLFRRIDPLEASPVLSDIADVVLELLLARTEEEFAKRHGRIPGAESAILAMGRLGSREMSITSDLDLMLVYDSPEDSLSDGERSVPSTSYFNRLLRRLVSALGAHTGFGEIYSIDMRLRPSGNAGPLAASLESFERYHGESAWTWERMALTRARVVAGSARLESRLGEIIQDTLSTPRDPGRLREDVADMRQRMDKEYHTDNPWSLKHYRGGLVDIEFIAQYLQLRTAPGRGETVAGNTGEAIQSLLAAGVLPEFDAAALLDAWQLWSRMQALQRLIKENADGRDIPNGMQTMFLDAAKIDSFDGMEERMSSAAAAVREIYDRIVGSPPG